MSCVWEGEEEGEGIVMVGGGNDYSESRCLYNPDTCYGVEAMTRKASENKVSSRVWRLRGLRVRKVRVTEQRNTGQELVIYLSQGV